MEDAESTARGNTTGKNPGVDQELLMSSKPLHRFVQREPRSLGIAIVIFGCAELLMGFHLSNDTVITSCEIYIPFWQGFLFLVCGSLSIYSELHPSKKMVTVSLGMYLVALFGIIVSAGYRIYCLEMYSYMSWRRWSDDPKRVEMLVGTEGALITSSLCVLVLLIFLSTIARLALKSTRTQIIVQHIPAPQSDATAN